MDLNFIKKLVKLLETTEITDIEVEENGTRIKLAKKVRVTQSISVAQPVTSTPPPTHGSPETSKLDEKKSSDEAANVGMHEVKSPIVGTFYRAPAPDADAYVQIGDVVSVGTVLCIVEAMKLMNEIESDINGKIVKILVDSGKPVEYNQPLFLIQQS
jgi:acetyl-CoA carboxylase biotin carboxyl carrier protein